ncbi:Cas1p-domain-containing protein [Hypoxylon trugodes]|uniref:Cas1p-domain-containing protein n=1 Tax=Hypoxylon trugodes TaxID=326681 RepID=UPI00219BC62A|nr:Cas1p-domain-containing protein [Hypoxylon trugodes]KAI1393558.1 Cas1p-domain-containing protein [Hypoxylon trugodes]
MPGLLRPLTWSHSITRITILAVAAIFGLQQYQEYKIGQYDPYGCQALLHDGQWSPLSELSAEIWEPKDCLMEKYSQETVRDCLTHRKVILAGDSTIRQLFWAFAKSIDPIHAKSEMLDIVLRSTKGKHTDLSFKDNDVDIEYIWDPWLNTTTLNNTLHSFHTLNAGNVSNKGELPTTLIVLGAPGLWAARYGEDDYMDLFKRGINGVLPYLSSNLNDDAASSSKRKARGLRGAANQVLLSPVHRPEYDVMRFDRFKTITPEKIEKMNDYLSKVSLDQWSHILWVFNKMWLRETIDHGSDGLHVSNAAVGHKLDVILNAHCNTAAKAKSRSFRGTCCVANPPNLPFQMALWVWSLTAITIPRYLRHRIRAALPRWRVESVKASRIILGILIWSCFCDGTHLIAKVERHYQQNEFLAVCFLWLVASFLSLHRSRETADGLSWSTNQTKRDPPGYRGPGYLSRDHSDEIKGLMQGFILLYHYHHASQTLWVYKIIRVFISAYFYLSGYGHTLYLLKTNDFSLRRVMIVLFRLNFLSALLPYVMGTTYSSYYFASAISFYYLVLHGTLAYFNRLNRRPCWLILKLITSAILTDIFLSTPGILESLAQLSHTIFRLSWDASEMRFRLRLDRYILFLSSAVAVLIHTESHHRTHAILPPNQTPYFPPISPKWRVVFYSVCAACILEFLIVTQTTLPTKSEYNNLHPYISWIPVLAFVVLRGRAKTAYLILPARLGGVALETYVLQYHIWLGANATAKLRIGALEGRVGGLVEVGLFTLAFGGVAALGHRATGIFARWMTEKVFLGFVLVLWVANWVYTW